jgi:Tfp pilus assembly protein PilF
MSNIDTFKHLLEKDKDNALLRYSLGNEYVRDNKFEEAIPHLEKAIELNPSHSASWKLYAKSLAENKQIKEAINAYEKGISIAEENGDIQCSKEMRVFLKRLKT